MTLTNLFREVLALGFEETGEPDAAFIFSANRALRLIFSELVGRKRRRIEKTADGSPIPPPDGISIITGAPEDDSGRPIAGARVDADGIRLPKDYSGEAYIPYKPIPLPLTLDGMSESIDIPPYAAHLLPILTAAYVLLDDDEDKAAFYLNVYREESARIRRTLPREYDSRYTDVTGWA